MTKLNDSDVPGKENFPFPAKQLSNRFIYEVLPDRSWKGKPCIVVGGGPSLQDFDWELLCGWRVIGVNRVYEKFDPTIIDFLSDIGRKMRADKELIKRHAVRIDPANQ